MTLRRQLPVGPGTGKTPAQYDEYRAIVESLRDQDSRLVVIEALNATSPGPWLAKAQNLADLADAALARGNLGLGALAVLGTVGTAQIDNAAVTYAKIQNVAGYSVFGKATTGAGVGADITAAADTVLGRSGSGDVAFGTIVTNQIGASQVTYAKIQNVSATDRLLGRFSAGAGVIEEITCTAAGRALLDDATAGDQRTTLGLGSLATVSNLTGPITSVGAATSIASQTGTGTTFAMQAAPTFTGNVTLSTGNLLTYGAATASGSGHLKIGGDGGSYGGHNVAVSIAAFGAVGYAPSTAPGSMSNDDAAKLQAAIDAVYDAGGGIVLLDPLRKYYINSNIQLKHSVTIAGSLCSPDAFDSTFSDTAPVKDFVRHGSQLTLGASGRIQIYGGGGLRDLLILYVGISNPKQTSVAAFRGVGPPDEAVMLEDLGCSLRNVLIIGFNKAISSIASSGRHTIDRVFGDCISGIEIVDSNDVSRVSNCHFWPWATEKSWPGDQTNQDIANKRAGTAYKAKKTIPGSSTQLCDWTRFTNCFSYGYAKGFENDGAQSTQFINCGADNTSTSIHTGSIGFHLAGSSADEVTIQGCQAAANEIGISISMTGGLAYKAKIVNCDIWTDDASSPYTGYTAGIKVAAGAVCLVEAAHCRIRGYTAGVENAATSGTTAIYLHEMAYRNVDNAVTNTGGGTYPISTGISQLAGAVVDGWGVTAANTLSVFTAGLNRGGFTSAGALSLTASVAGGKLQLNAESADNTVTAYFAGLNVVSNTVVGYPAIGYNIASGNAGNTWRFQGADHTSWIQFRGREVKFYRNSNAPSAGALITGVETLAIDASGNVTTEGYLTIKSGSDWRLGYNADGGSSNVFMLRYQTGGVNAINVKTDGNTGIGCVPGVKLEVLNSGTLGTAGDYVTQAVAQFTGQNWNFNSSQNPANLQVSSSQAFGADVGATIGLGGRYQTGTTFAQFAIIKGAKENATDGNYSSYLAFGTRTSGFNIIEQMRISSTGAVTCSNPTGGLGYGTGAGGTVTQTTNKTNSVTLNKVCGTITMDGAALAANTTVSFAFNNSAIAAGDRIVVTHESVGSTGGYMLNARVTGAGTAAIDVRNVTAGSLSEAIVLGFTVFKSTTS